MMDNVLLVLLALALALIVFNPANWIRLALLVVGPARRPKFLAALQVEIDKEQDFKLRAFYQIFLEEAKK